MKQTENRQNPWAGLSSYEDPAKSKQPLKFCGRDKETKEVARLIDDNFFVTLYGKSGIGKTSLLNAGVFPALRREQYTPLSLRLGMTDERLTFQEIIMQAIEHAITEVGGSVQIINVIDEQGDYDDADCLWRWFARRRFLTADGQVTFPVLVFDQFEEVFRHADSRKKTEVLLNQLNYLIDEGHAIGDVVVDGEEYSYDFNFRFVLSIREDDLYRLEDTLDNCSLSALKRCRYRLRSLTEQGAKDVILIPGGDLFEPEEQTAIADVIISKSRNEDDSISTNIISLLCSRIFVDFQKSDADHITPALVDNFIKGNPFERFYNEATRGFSDHEKSYIEEHLVDSTGRRNSIPESDFLLHVPKGKDLLEGDTRILQRTSTSSNGSNYRIELIHDSFCEPLAGLKEKRERRKRLWQILITFSVAIFSVVAVVYVLNINHKMNVNMSRVLAEKAKQLTDDHDSYLARLIALQALPPHRPYTVEAEAALRSACKQDDAVLRGHTDDVSSASFSPDNKYIVSASYDNTIRIWDAQTGKELKKLEGLTEGINSVSFSPDGKRIVSASWDNTIRIWDAKTGKELKKMEGHTNIVNSASFSPDGKRIVSASQDRTVRIWDTQTGKELKKLEGHTDIVWFTSFSPDGKCIVSASDDHTVRIWDAQTGKELKKLEGHTSGVNSASFSPDGKRIVSASRDNTVRIWDAQTGKELKKLEGHTSLVNSASFSPDSKYIVSASYDNTIRIWSAQTGKELKKLEGYTEGFRSASFSPDGKRIVSVSYDNTVRIWETQTVHELKKLEGHTAYVNSVCFSPDGKYFVSTSRDNTVKIWNAQTGKELKKLEGHTCDVESASFSPDGKRIVSASWDNTVRIWDALSGKELKKLEGHTNYVQSASFSPDGKRIVSASWDNTVRIWDAQTGKELKKLDGHTSHVQSASFSPDGKRIVSASWDGTVRIWDAQTGKELKKLEGLYFVNSASFSPNGKCIVSASSDNTIRIWDAQTGEELKKLEEHTGSVYSASFNRDGNRIVSTSLDKTVRIWDAQTGKELQKLEGHTDNVNSATFSPDGNRIVSVSNDHTIRIWDFPPLEDLIDQTRERFKNRPLTPEERQKYYLE